MAFRGDETNGLPARHHQMIDVVSTDGTASAVLREAAALMNLELRGHMIGAISDRRRLAGLVLVIEAKAGAVASQLLLSGLRERSHGRIILIAQDLTAENRMLSRLHGADHVLDATIGAREIAAIIRNDLRLTAVADTHVRSGEEAHNWQLDPGRWSLITPNCREVRLTFSEYALLQLLIDSPGLVLPRPTLRAAIQGDAGRTRVLDSVVSRLRRKVWDCAGLELPLRSARNEGYVFAGMAFGRGMASEQRTAAMPHLSASRD